MDPALTSVVLVVPCGLVVLAGLVYLYGLVVHLFSQTLVRNKVVVISDALSSLGRGEDSPMAVRWSRRPEAAW